jgi:hypothetical protein
VVERIAAQANITVRHLDKLPDTRVSVRFTDLSVAEGLKRLFRTAEISGYALITERGGGSMPGRRTLFLLPAGSRPGIRSTTFPGRRPQEDNDPGETTVSTSGGTVFEDLNNNATARRLLSQLVHPNEQVRERALESLIQLVGDDQKQAQLLEFVEPLLDDMASDDKTAHAEARAEIRQLLTR